MAQQIVRTKYISRILASPSGENIFDVSFPRLTAEDLGVSAANNTLFSERYIKNLKARINIQSLPFVPVPVFNLGMSEAEKLTAIVENEKNNPHKMMQMLIKGDGLFDEWGEIGNILMLNRNQSYNSRLSIFFTEGDVLELDSGATFSVRMVSDGHGLLSSGDWIHIYGLYKEICTVFPNEKNSIVYTHNRINIPAGQTIQLAAANSERRYFRVANVGNTEIPNSTAVLWMQEGNGQAAKVGAPLYMQGAFEWNWNYLEPPLGAAVWGYSEEGTTAVVTQGI